MFKQSIREQQIASMQNTYQVKYIKNMHHGKGRLDTVDGQSYVGDFKLGLRCGHGVCKYPDGSMYDGEWDNDMPCGHGEFTTREGNCIEGEFMGKNCTSSCTVRFATGEVYSGPVRNLRPHGDGIITFPDGSEYTG